VCLRYVFNNQLREDFIDHVSVEDMTGEGVAATILTHLRQLRLDLSFMVGQGYDGASAMKGIFHGVQAVIRLQLPAAVHVHCSSHYQQHANKHKFEMHMALLEKSLYFSVDLPNV